MTDGHGIRISVEELIGLRRDGISLSLGQDRGRALLAGSYRSVFRGRGMDFEEVRAYQPGDDIRRMDWRVTARSNRPHTKLFSEERERPVLLCVDTGASMQFGTRVAFKSVQACRTAALLGWAALENHDRVGAITFGSQASRSLRPAGGKRALLHCLQALSEASAAPATAANALHDTLLQIRTIARHGMLIILISDFNGLDETAEAYLHNLARHNSLLAIQIYDPLEAELPPPGNYAFSDGQQILDVWTDDPVARQHYREAFVARREYLAGFFRQCGIRGLSISTAESATRVLQRELRGRQCYHDASSTADDTPALEIR